MSNTATMPAPTTDDQTKGANTASRVLTANDRCDCCQAQAYVEVSKPGITAALLFCGHHFNRHEAAILADGWNENVNNLDKLRGGNTKPDGGSAAG